MISFPLDYEAQALGLLLNQRTGHVHALADGSALWADAPPSATTCVFSEDRPIGVAFRRMSFHQARREYRTALTALARR